MTYSVNVLPRRVPGGSGLAEFVIDSAVEVLRMDGSMCAHDDDAILVCLHQNVVAVWAALNVHGSEAHMVIPRGVHVNASDLKGRSKTKG